jgi:hypothetical protein
MKGFLKYFLAIKGYVRLDWVRLNWVRLGYLPRLGIVMIGKDRLGRVKLCKYG